MNAAVYGCHNRKPFRFAYLPTGGDQPIKHVTTTACQYRKTQLGKDDPKCEGCRWREEGADQ